jgi:Tfp pilus assembly protein PilV
MSLPPLARVRNQDGFSLIIVLSVMLVTSLIVAAAFTATRADLPLTQQSTHHTQAQYAALGGVQEYDYQLQNNPDYWESCEGPSGELEGAYYEVKVLPSTGQTACSASSPFTTAIESKGKLANTFRIESTACAGPAKLTSCKGEMPATVEKRSTVATFQVTGFLDFAYFTQYEDEDPSIYLKENHAKEKECSNVYYGVRQEKKYGCTEIEFAEEDSVHGPMHTDDAANVGCGKSEFGRNSTERNGAEPDLVEIKGGVNELCGTAPIINTSNGKLTTPAKQMEPPPTDGSLALYVESKNKLEGVTHVVLNGSANTIEVTTNKGNTVPMAWPENGLLYIAKEKGGTCSYEYEQVKADLANEAPEEAGCGTVYVSGTYSKSLTIAAENDVVINGSIVPTGVTPGEEPGGTETLGLIATEFVRIYHPVAETHAKVKGSCGGDPEIKSTGMCEYVNNEGSCDAPNTTGTMHNPWVYAAILSTAHSFLVDNYTCGNTSETGKLNIYGAIAQKYRGIVAIGNGTSVEHGYTKDYNYDERLATDEPPYFLAPLKAGWKIIRETSPTSG